MTTLSKTTKAALALAAVTTVGVSMVPTDAEAGWRGRRNAAIAAGVIGGLALGALAVSSAHAHYGHGYYAPAYAPSCYWVKQRRVTWDGYVVVRNVRVCD